MTSLEWDDIYEPDSDAATVRKAVEFVERLGIIWPEFVRGGAYRNRDGDLVTWDASADGKYVVFQTWPGE